MNDPLQPFAAWRGAGEPFAVATVIKVEGSAPRGEGAQMLVSITGKISGSVSGGCVEAAVAEEAQSVLASKIPKVVRYGINRNMMWDVGLSCGGAIEVFVEPDDAFDRCAPAENNSRAWALCTIVRGRDIGRKLVVGDDGQAAGNIGDPSISQVIVTAALKQIAERRSGTESFTGCDVFIDVVLPQARLVIVGAVHVAVALCDFASRAGFSVTIVDPRAKLNNTERFPTAVSLIVGWPEAALPTVGFDENTYVAVLTHDEKFDDPTLDIVLRSRARYVGAIGSKKTQQLRRTRLEQAGFALSNIDRLHAPIGLDIGAESPEEIAVAILAEMIAAKYGHGGEPLKNRNRESIHA
ncbi:MAG: XdhC family protein [Candidatus Eremiobacteraeota bacterium]|nr:XdhC family protein [Candidatus Eremiobacteraeota bacterium]MBC5827697.1 XdhC family protein [Candidatus Eremiobacteraeota bacterium]